MKDDEVVDPGLEAAFESAFQGGANADKPAEVVVEVVAETPEPAKAEKAEEVAEVTKAEEAAPTAPTQKPDEDLRSELRKLHGKVGDLNDKLLQALKPKETEGKPAVLSGVELKRTLAEFPELANLLTEDLGEALKGISPGAVDPQQVEALVNERVSNRVNQEIAQLRRDQTLDVHPNWIKDLWVTDANGTPTNQRTESYTAWLKTMPEADQVAFEKSNNPSFVNRKLTDYYAWQTKTAKAATEKQDRLKAAITPQGVAKTGPQTISEEDAIKKAFEEAFNA